MFTKCVIVVDEDCDVQDVGEVTLRVANNIDPERDIQFTMGPIDRSTTRRGCPTTAARWVLTPREVGRGRLQPALAADDRDGHCHQGTRGCNLEKTGARRMRQWQLRFVVWMAAPAAFYSTPAVRAQSIENFRWLDLHQPSDAQTIVARALMNEPYTALREVGYIGLPQKEQRAPIQGTSAAAGGTALNVSRLPVPRDAHLLVITAERTNPSALPDDDVLSVDDVNQRQITATLLLRGPGLHLLGWVRMWREGSPEMAATYNDCVECQRTTFFTTFHIDLKIA